MFEEIATYGAVVAAITHLGRGILATALLPALSRRWPMLLRRRGLAASSAGDRPMGGSPCSGCSGCAGGQRPQSQVVVIGSSGTANR
ncbi:MAG: hypothetical protein FAZ92_01739 [Accumulibacter sp.]|uniref:hypothetical protein n=1 Tax=Accumulibacter sp. TaxID=2053492 RepID=UPI0011FA7C16|nr:hypothetical protein [Accumulibacter sp.]TLD45971.1 MAG: hypothetical protein FAZ92_01739 [Accumulibacter sp.]